jgi:hypothetical protein
MLEHYFRKYNETIGLSAEVIKMAMGQLLLQTAHPKRKFIQPLTSNTQSQTGGGANVLVPGFFCNFYNRACGSREIK